MVESRVCLVGTDGQVLPAGGVCRPASAGLFSCLAAGEPKRWRQAARPLFLPSNQQILALEGAGVCCKVVRGIPRATRARLEAY